MNRCDICNSSNVKPVLVDNSYEGYMCPRDIKALRLEVDVEVLKSY